ncbi:hypothetical protein GALMADRAFT_271165 [Galerina marginata CBS 339.88]|uniref:Terpene synthase n=1 Tax=Galerina marginata (strain CBS 339.88) TaxID=685588 RepID=A0A067SL26_GALM3|nr:hypothetical protein GALMADRAFT_271165 [Galerina marginata CBS 339.88]
MSSNHSFQLPDLISIIGSLELRTNRHCRLATDTSEKWFTDETGILSKNELSYLRSTKIGLLCALCFPTSDAPQLRMLTDLATAVLYSGIREYSNKSPRHSSWDYEIFTGSLNPLETPGRPETGVDLFKKHRLFKHMPNERLVNIISKASTDWNHQFTESMQGLRSAQQKVVSNQSNNIIPSLEEYTELRKEMYGSSMVLDIAELLEIFQCPRTNGTTAEKITNLKRAALDVIAWSMDVVSYQLNQSRGNTHNLVAVLMSHKNLSVQGAMNLSGNMIKDAFTSFCSAEQSVLESLEPQRSLNLPILSWVWPSLTTNRVPASGEEAEAISEGVRRYIRALKDCMVGSVHWAYESELFFGRKGVEIRTFGWVFVDQVPVIPD